jgi:hypothetical protein
VEQVASNSHLANAVLQLNTLDWTQLNKVQIIPLKFKDSNAQEVGQIHLQITVLNSLHKKLLINENINTQEYNYLKKKNQMSERAINPN